MPITETGSKHLVIPDTQCRPGVPVDHFSWIGAYAADKRPDVIVHLGDWYDMNSLCSYDKESNPKDFHARSYEDDLAAGDLGVTLFELALAKAKGYRPRKVYLRGNHEERYERLIRAEPNLARSLVAPWTYAEDCGWDVRPFLEPIDIDGILYCHYFCRGPSGMVTNSRNGNPSAKLQVTREMQSCTAGHKQGLDVHVQPTARGMVRGVIAGSCYQHDDEYLSPQGTRYWRGILMKHEVRQGDYNLLEVSLSYLKRKYAQRAPQGRRKAVKP
jgi:hypothetical protein